MSEKVPPQSLPSFGGPVDILALLGGGSGEVRRDEALELELLSHWQAGLPLDPQPFQRMGEHHGRDGREVRAALRRLRQEGVLARVGAVVTPAAFGASTLAALCAPPGQIDAIAGYICLMPEVNYVFAREHDFNLWFVLTAVDRTQIDRAINRIHEATGCRPLDLPMEAGFFVDPGAAPIPSGGRNASAIDIGRVRTMLDHRQWRLLNALEAGLPLVPRPFARLGMRAGMHEREVIEQLRGWQDRGALRRLGLVLRQTEPAISVSALCVWDVPDAEAFAFGRRVAEVKGVNLCYRRARHAGLWPYNLHCMIYERSREAVLQTCERVSAEAGLSVYPAAVLFSARRYKQRGALFFDVRP